MIVSSALPRALKQVENGFYLVIGGTVRPSSTDFGSLRELGWSGLHVRTNGSGGVLVTLEDGGDREAAAPIVGAPSTPASPLSTVLDELSHSGKIPPAVHVLGLREGVGRPVLSTAALQRVRPWLVDIESAQSPDGGEALDWERILRGRGYQLAYNDGRSRIFVASEHPELVLQVRSMQRALLDGGRADVADHDGREADGVSTLSSHSEVLKLASDYKRLRRERDELLASLDVMTRDRDFYRVAHAKLKMSLSWRITSPLRAFGRAGKHGKRAASALRPPARFVLLPPLAIGQSAAVRPNSSPPPDLPHAAGWIHARLHGRFE